MSSEKYYGTYGRQTAVTLAVGLVSVYHTYTSIYSAHMGPLHSPGPLYRVVCLEYRFCCCRCGLVLLLLSMRRTKNNISKK